MKHIITIECEECSKEFQARSWDVENRNKKFCSRSCKAKNEKGKKKASRVVLECAQCGISFERLESEVKRGEMIHKSDLAFCSRECKDTAQRIGGREEIRPAHYSSEYPVHYRKYAFRHYPNECNRCGWDFYVEVLKVHHKDRNRNNNALDNLEILCPTCHEVDHFLAGDGHYNYGPVV